MTTGKGYIATDSCGFLVRYAQRLPPTSAMMGESKLDPRTSNPTIARFARVKDGALEFGGQGVGPTGPAKTVLL